MHAYIINMCICLLPVFMKQQNYQPNRTEDHATGLSHRKRPGDSGYTGGRREAGERS